MDPQNYCRQIESYLCQKNDGHLVRVSGPAFELVTRWATDGVPFKVACGGIDRYFERYYRKGPRRRPVRIEFCDADVRDVFDEWRRATGIMAASASAAAPGQEAHAATASHRGPSLPEHLERALVRLTNARVMGRLDGRADALIDAVSSELDEARGAPGGVRGDARQRLLSRLVDRDTELSAIAYQMLNAETIESVTREATEALDGFKDQMTADRLARTRDITVDRLIRARLSLPILSFT